MSGKNPYEILGVTETASFEEIQSAKQRLKETHGEDVKVSEDIEAAYDAIIMDRLKLRQEGKIKVPEQIRFPDRLSPVEKVSQVMEQAQAPEWMQDFVDTPEKENLLLTGGIYGSLALATVFSGPANASLILAGGFGANLFLINRKHSQFGRAIAIGLVALLLGTLGGGAIAGLVLGQGWATGLTSEQISVLLGLVIFWATSSFLR